MAYPSMPQQSRRELQLHTHRIAEPDELPTKAILWQFPERRQAVLNRLGFRYYTQGYMLGDEMHMVLQQIYGEPLQDDGSHDCELIQAWARVPVKVLLGSDQQRSFNGPLPDAAVMELDMADGLFHGLLLCWNAATERYEIWGLHYGTITGAGRYIRPEYYKLVTWSYETEPGAAFVAPAAQAGMARWEVDAHDAGDMSFFDQLEPGGSSAGQPGDITGDQLSTGARAAAKSRSILADSTDTTMMMGMPARAAQRPEAWHTTSDEPEPATGGWHRWLIAAFLAVVLLIAGYWLSARYGQTILSWF